MYIYFHLIELNGVKKSKKKKIITYLSIIFNYISLILNALYPLYY